MGLTVSQCEQLLAEAPADKVKKHPAGDGLYFVVGRDRAYWSYQFPPPHVVVGERSRRLSGVQPEGRA